MINHDAPHQLSGRHRSWVTSRRVDRASSYGLLNAANSNTAKGFLERGPEAIKKTAQSWRVSVALCAYAHESAKQQKPENQNRKQTSFHESIDPVQTDNSTKFDSPFAA
jgi:hypothetical protein